MDDDILDDNTPIQETADESADKDNSANKGNAISADLIRGHINTIILRTLYERDKYGYEIMNEIEQKSHGQYALKQPTLYSALKRLETQGYIKAYWKTDYVTLGGRRKYFTLTEIGKEFAEKNQSEWEYSRTVIDSLISDKSFDFNQPAPTPVDFNILKKSVTRVPTGNAKEESQADSEQINITDNETSNQVNEESNVPPVQTEFMRALNEYDDENYNQEYDQPLYPQQAEATFQNNPQPIPEPSERIAPDFDTRSEEEKRIAHENYLKLISEDVRFGYEPEEPIVPNSDEIDTEKLIYNNKPETERDYKTLVSNIFSKAIKPDEPVPQPNVIQQPNAQQFMQEVVQPNAPTMNIDPVIEKGNADGLKVNTTSYSTTRAKKAKNTTYDLGATLFKSSCVIGFIMMLEFMFSLIFRDALGVSLGYPFVIFALAIAQFAAFGILLWLGFGKNSARPTTHSYISVSVILTIIAILIICLCAFLLNVNVQSAGDIMAKIVFPIFVALNIPIFTISFWLFSKNSK